MNLSRKIVFCKIKDKRTEKLLNTSLSLDFWNKPSLFNKPPFLLSPPLEGQKLNKPTGGLIELLQYYDQRVGQLVKIKYD